MFVCLGSTLLAFTQHSTTHTRESTKKVVEEEEKIANHRVSERVRERRAKKEIEKAKIKS